MIPQIIDLARQAGALLVEGLRRGPEAQLKSAYEVVTDIDRASEALIVGSLRRDFPDIDIIAEEGSRYERGASTCWLIDPLDGTNNYAHGFPFFAVSIALVRERDPILGVIFDPLRDEMFVASAGAGAWCNDRPMRVSRTSTLAAALLSTGFPYTYATTPDNNLRQFDRLQSCTQGVRRAGAAALDLAYVAHGRLDGHWEWHLNPWDSAAGALLVREAGGRVSTWAGTTWNPWSDRLVASNGAIHAPLVAVLADPE